MNDMKITVYLPRADEDPQEWQAENWMIAEGSLIIHEKTKVNADKEREAVVGGVYPPGAWFRMEFEE